MAASLRSDRGRRGRAGRPARAAHRGGACPGRRRGAPGTATPGRARRRCGRRSGPRAHPSSAPRGRGIPPEPANRAPAARGRPHSSRPLSDTCRPELYRSARAVASRPSSSRSTYEVRSPGPVGQLRSEPPRPCTNTTRRPLGSSTAPSGHGSPRWNSCMAMARSLPVSCSSSPTAALSAASVESPRDDRSRKRSSRSAHTTRHPTSAARSRMRLAERIDPWTPPVSESWTRRTPPAPGPRASNTRSATAWCTPATGAVTRSTTPTARVASPRTSLRELTDQCLDEQLDEVVDATLGPVLVGTEGQVLDDEGEHEPDDGAGDRR